MYLEGNDCRAPWAIYHNFLWVLESVSGTFPSAKGTDSECVLEVLREKIPEGRSLGKTA